MRIAYFDCYAGASGDMILAALIDAGADLEQLRAELATLALPGVSFRARPVVKQGFAAVKFDVIDEATGQPIDHTEDRGEIVPSAPGKGGGGEGEGGPKHAHSTEHSHDAHRHHHPHRGHHRHLRDIAAVIQASALAETTKRRATDIFSRLAQAEAKAHGVDVDSVHFHEVGAADAIIDVVGACVALDLLGIDRVLVSPLPPGSGTVRTAHGLMPVPAPATAELLRGMPLAENLNPGESVTPTGAAILTTLAQPADLGLDAAPPGARLLAIGVGAGARDGANVPNLLRVMIGELAAAEKPSSVCAADTADTVALLETNLDDADGVTIGHCFELLLEAGALDVWATPIVMKKNRPAYMLSVLCQAGSDAIDACRAILFGQTGTLGVREQRMGRSKLARESVTVETPYGAIRVKVGRLDGRVVGAQPEYEDCRAAADRTGVSLTEARRAALAAYRQGHKEEPIRDNP